jgi:uncharacterized repeat protein (TIGR01451 family)
MGSGQSVTLSSGNVPDSAETSALHAGDYSYQAVYSGDGNYTGSTGACEPFSIAQAGSSTATVVKDHSGTVVDHANPAALGSMVHDTATVTAGPFTATGTVTYQLYSGLTCKAGNELGSAEQVSLSGGNVPDSSETSALDAGDYSYQAVYSGDGNYTGSTGACEPFSVGKAAPSIVTTQDPASGSVGDTYRDKAILSGGGNPTGTITFDLYDNDSCSGTAVFEEPASVANGNGTYETPNGVALNKAGDYWWVAKYGGDSNNLSAQSGCADEPVVVKGASIHIVKKADKAQVSVGDTIGFTMTVSNDGTGDAHGVKLSDTLPVKPGLAWTVDKTGAGWGNSCSIAAGVLSCGGAGGVTVPAGTTQAASIFTVHISSVTTAAAGGDCPKTGVVDNTGTVTTSNAGSDESSASTCVQAVVDLAITKTGSPARQEGLGNITWTMVVTNNGPSADTGVTISDPMPSGNTYVSATATKGSCTGGAILHCTIGDMAAGEQVTITLVTTPSAAGTQTNTAVVMGDRPETTLSNNTATASVVVVAPHVIFCVAVTRITPDHLIVGRKTTLTVHLTRHGQAVKGIRVRIKGPKLNVRTVPSNGKGIIKRVVTMKKKGIITITPLTAPSCGAKRIGVRGVFTPPVTG